MVVSLGKTVFTGSPRMYELCFGTERNKWTHTKDHWELSVQRIKNKVRPILKANGRVWVAEGGTHDWVTSLIAEGFSERLIKSNVFVVQGS